MKIKELRAICFSVLFLAVAFALPLLYSVSNPLQNNRTQLFSRVLNTPTIDYSHEMTS
jgi:hypothetical protein